MPPGTRISDATIEEVKPTPTGCLVVFSWGREPHTYGLPVDLRDVSRGYVPGEPVESWLDWLALFPVNLLTHLDTGVVENAARRQRKGYIELDDTKSWPYLQSVDYEVVGRDEIALSKNPLRMADLSVSTSDCQDVLAAVTATPRGRSAPSVLALVRRTDVNSGELRLALDVHASHRSAIDCAHLACHEAAKQGAHTLLANANIRGLSALGFAPRNGTLAQVDTTFLEEDWATLESLDDDPANHPGQSDGQEAEPPRVVG